MAGIKRITYTHEAMIDLILQEPSVTPQELAELFDRSKAWISRIVSSDSFKARLAERKGALVDPLITQSLHERLAGVAVHAIDIMSEKLETERSADYALSALNVATVALK